VKILLDFDYFIKFIFNLNLKKIKINPTVYAGIDGERLFVEIFWQWTIISQRWI
jgi:hypothetical protein